MVLVLDVHGVGRWMAAELVAEHLEHLQQNTWIDDRKFLKSCVRAGAEQSNINHPAYGTWMAGFMLRQNESRAFLGKYLNNPRPLET